MSERGSFVTQYIYCKHCLDAAKTCLLGEAKYHCGWVLPSWLPGETLPIIAGKLGGLYQGEELVEFEEILVPRLSALLCHPLRVAVIAEYGERIFIIPPEKRADC